MPEKKGRSDKPKEFFRVEATAHYTTELNEKLEGMYPLVNEGDDDLLEKINDGRITYFSFDLTGRNPFFVKKLLIKSIERAADAKDMAYSRHGSSRHDTFQEATVKLIESVESATAKMTRLQYPKNIRTDSGKIDVVVDRFELNTPYFERDTFRPRPHQVAGDLDSLPQSRTEKGRNKLIRNEIYKHGVSYGILVAAYTGLSTDETLDIFMDTNVRRNIQEKHGKNVKIPHRSQREDIFVISEIGKIVTSKSSREWAPSPYPKSYNDALEILLKHGYVNADESQKKPFDFIPSTDAAYARGVFKGVTEAAHEIAPSEFIEPERSDYISRNYKSHTTSRLITAFLVID